MTGTVIGTEIEIEIGGITADPEIKVGIVAAAAEENSVVSAVKIAEEAAIIPMVVNDPAAVELSGVMEDHLQDEQEPPHLPQEIIPQCQVGTFLRIGVPGMEGTAAIVSTSSFLI